MQMIDTAVAAAGALCLLMNVAKRRFISYPD